VGDPTGYGRIVRAPDGALERIVEHKDASEAVRAIDEINSGLYCFERGALFEALERTDRSNAQNEYYLTDVVEKMNARGLKVAAYLVDDDREVAGVNTVEELEAISRFIRDGRR
jgi:bifunctional N-acetylglucosamine-1-phosphate-uridyltransferase/glucosamine-1-phosphate-acetyltransferase GlmU-like protein